MSAIALMYHYVRGGYTGAGIFGPTVEAFEAQLDALLANAPVAMADRVLHRLKSRTPGDRDVLLTFDDGLKDHVRNVLPALVKRGLTGVFFVMSGPLAEGYIPTVHKIHLLRRHFGEEAFADLVSERLPPVKESRSDADTSGKLYRWDSEKVRRIKTRLMYENRPDETEAIIDPLFNEALGSPREAARELFVDFDDVRELARQGMIIGAHGHRHHMLSRLSIEEQTDEVARCQTVLSDALGRPVSEFCYPYGKPGSFDGTTQQVLRDAGFDLAFTSEPGPINPANALAIRRYDPVDAFSGSALRPGIVN